MLACTLLLIFKWFFPWTQCCKMCPVALRWDITGWIWSDVFFFFSFCIWFVLLLWRSYVKLITMKVNYCMLATKRRCYFVHCDYWPLFSYNTHHFVTFKITKLIPEGTSKGKVCFKAREGSWRSGILKKQIYFMRGSWWLVGHWWLKG